MFSSREHAHYPLLSFSILLLHHPSPFCFFPPFIIGHYHTLTKIVLHLPILPGVDSNFHWRTRRRRVSYNYRRVSNDYWTAPASSLELFHCRQIRHRLRSMSIHCPLPLQYHEENEESQSAHALTMHKISYTHVQKMKDDPPPQSSSPVYSLQSPDLHTLGIICNHFFVPLIFFNFNIRAKFIASGISNFFTVLSNLQVWL